MMTVHTQAPSEIKEQVMCATSLPGAHDSRGDPTSLSLDRSFIIARD